MTREFILLFPAEMKTLSQNICTWINTPFTWGWWDILEMFYPMGAASVYGQVATGGSTIFSNLSTSRNETRTMTVYDFHLKVNLHSDVLE